MKITKFIVPLLIALFVALFPVKGTFAATDAITIIVNGNKQNFTQQPIVKEGRVLLPFRELFEILGADIEWDEEQGKIVANKGRIAVELQPGSNKGIVNNKIVSLDELPTMINGRTLVSLRFISEVFGGEVTWDKVTRTVTVNSMSKAEMILNNTLEASKNIKSVAIESDYSAVGSIGKMELNMYRHTYGEFNFNVFDRYIDVYEDTTDNEIYETEIYFVNDDGYFYFPFEDIWYKLTPGDATSNELVGLFNSHLNYQLVEDIEKMKHFSGIFTVSETDENYILNEVVGPEDSEYVRTYLQKALINKDGPDAAMLYDTHHIDHFSYTIAISKTTNLIDNEQMVIELSTKIADGSKTSFTISIDGTFSDYNKDFEIVIPDDAKQSAIVPD